jgi:hypothetical protein
MKLTILCFAAALVLMPATAVARVDAGEFLVDPGVVYEPAEQNQLSSAAASNSVNSLIVWADWRNGSHSDIYGARLDHYGNVLDEASIAISTAATAQNDAAVGSDGTNYLVAWADQRADSGDIYVCRVTSDGSVLDPEGIPVSTASRYQGEPAVAFDGTNYLVVWPDERNDGSDIYGARVTRDGTVLDTAGIALVSDSAGQTAPAVAYDGANVLLIWGDTRSDQGDIYGARVSSDGTLLDSAGFVIAAAPSLQHSPEIALGVDEALVVWVDLRGGPDTDIYGSRITRDGEVLDSAGIAIATSSWYEFDARVTFDGTQYLVVWTDAVAHGNVLAGRVATDGTVIDPLGFFISQGGEYAGSPAVTFDGLRNVVAWSDVRAGMADQSVSVARVDGNGMVLDPQGIPVSNAASSQKLPDAAFDGTEFLVVWGEARAGISDIYGVRLTPEGAVVDSTGIRISPPNGDQAYAALAHGLSNFLVVWEDGRFRERDVCGARVDHDGVVLDTAGILISGPPWEQCAPAVGSDGTDFLVAWQDFRNSSYDIYCARVSWTGLVLDTAGVAVCTTSGARVTPAVAYNGTDYLVLWEYQDVGIREIHGARVNRQGIVLDPAGFIVSATAGVGEQPAAASDGDNFLVVWSDWQDGDRDIYGARVTATGTVLDTAGIEICSAPGTQDRPAVEYDGTNFLVVWQDQRDGERDLYGARVTPEGTILDTFTVITQPGYQVDPVLARNGGSKMLLAYSGWTGVVQDVPYNSPRIWATLSPVAATEEGPNAVASVPRPAVTIVRGVLLLGAADGRQNSEHGAELLDVSGRKVLNLHPGANDVRAQAPGVYFVREAQAQARAVRKVVITR